MASEVMAAAVSPPEAVAVARGLGFGDGGGAAGSGGERLA